MRSYDEMSKEELLREKEALEKRYKEYLDKGLHLDMTRGKPCTEQLDLSMPMLDTINSSSDMRSTDGTDCRNYGLVEGLPEAKKLMADMMGADPSNVIVFGNASLNIMYDTVARSIVHGVLGHTPWSKLGKVKFLCPVPGYDRHFGITESFQIEMINIPMLPTGPDMDMVEELVSKDEAIKGIWCVPKYTNPQGISYSDETVRRFAALKPAAMDFRIFWDNAYCVHHIYEDRQDELLDIISECEKAGNPDMVYEFCSTSKVTFPGAGISAMASSKANLRDLERQMRYQTIGHDKINQLRHVRFFDDFEGIKAHMMKHAALIRPKFEMILEEFEHELSGLGVGDWVKPNGGYFIAFSANKGCAKEIVAKAKDAGVILTGAGAPFPNRKDPEDSVIRLAPTLPPMEDLEIACQVFILCVKLVSIEKYLEK